MDTIGKRVEYFLAKEGIETKDFADSIELHTNSVYRMINEDRGMNSTTLVKIIKAYPELNIDWLLTGVGYYKKNTNSSGFENTANEEREPYLTKNDAELKTKVRTILNNEVVLDAFIEILKRYDK